MKKSKDRGEGILYIILLISFIGLFISILIDYLTGAVGWGLMLLSSILFLVGIEINKKNEGED